MTEQETLQVTVRSMYSYLIERGYYDDYSKWTTEKIKQYENTQKAKSNNSTNSNHNSHHKNLKHEKTNQKT